MPTTKGLQVRDPFCSGRLTPFGGPGMARLSKRKILETRARIIADAERE